MRVEMTETEISLLNLTMSERVNLLLIMTDQLLVTDTGEGISCPPEGAWNSSACDIEAIVGPALEDFLWEHSRRGSPWSCLRQGNLKDRRAGAFFPRSKVRCMPPMPT